MLKINLLPVRQLQRRAKAKSQIFITIGLVLLIIFICVLISIKNKSDQETLQTNITQLQNETRSYAPILKKIKKLKADKIELDRKKAIIEDLKTNSSITVHVMDEVSNSVDNKRLWVNSLKQQGASLTITGIALDNRTISIFMNTLKKSPYINSVNLSETSQQNVAGRDLKKFSLNCSVSSPKAEQEKPEKS